MTTTTTTTASSPFLKKMKLQENIEWELSTPLELEDVEKKPLFCLLKSVRQNYNLKWYLMWTKILLVI